MTLDEPKWRSRGADPMLESFYTTTYASAYQRPKTTSSATARSVNGNTSRSITTSNTILTTGYSTNNHVSPLELAPLSDRKDYRDSHSHEVYCPESSITTLMRDRPIVRAAMERSGYWNEPLPNVLYESPAMRAQTARERTITASNLDPLTLRRMTKHNPIDGENGGAGPDWGSTTYNKAFIEHESNHSRYWRTDRNLIGKREPDAFTRNHLTIPQKPVDDQISTYTASYRKPPTAKEITIPNRSVMERSGYTASVVPTINKAALLSDVTADDLHPIEVNKLKHVNTPEYQNLFEPDPYKSMSEVTFTPPARTIERALDSKDNVRHGRTGYGANETVRAGPPGDPRYYKTGKTEEMKSFKDPTPVIRARTNHSIRPNVMERSGYWAT
ncbi:hypothetical protein TRFO_19891 [Tritrichomonas foetus]|uniref:Uncharacterized protein n=1 Tax=Tritrichomonas foetus TaxID=1144522 RepID=A0A1J4KLS9_9EUKA|nr:hypothetical protein TRFO_19891 [Tritrichomonas foetus]|eukprot:OHT10756.1 hypothetical protein TRFO_19891 [Tritrichomonas foetus]